MTSLAATNSQRVYRVDRFRVPAAARAEFLEQVRATHEVLRSQSGFVQDFVLEQAAGPDFLHVVTVVVWRDADALGQAKNTVVESRKATGFDPNEMLRRLKIEAELGNYAEVVM